MSFWKFYIYFCGGRQNMTMHKFYYCSEMINFLLLMLSFCQDKNPATEGVVVQKRACQCYLSREASDHLGMTVLFQTWPNLLEIAPGYLALWQTPLWKSNQVDLVCVSIAVVFG